jgi:hypothetical protein
MTSQSRSFRRALPGIILSLSVVALFASPCRGTVIWDESVSGDLSNNQAAPNAFTLASGTNSVIGMVGPSATDKQDWIALTIPAGFSLSSDILAAYSSTDPQGFTGVQAGASFVGDPETSASSYLGYAHYGTGAMNGAAPLANLVGADLLPIMGNTNDAQGAQGFTGPLPAGTYTFLIQQLGAATTYQFDFVVTSVPEPASLCLLGFAGLAMLRRRGRPFQLNGVKRRPGKT